MHSRMKALQQYEYLSTKRVNFLEKMATLFCWPSLCFSSLTVALVALRSPRIRCSLLCGYSVWSLWRCRATCEYHRKGDLFLVQPCYLLYSRPPGVRGPIPDPRREFDKTREGNVTDSYPTTAKTHWMNPMPYMSAFVAYTFHIPAVKLKRKAV